MAFFYIILDCNFNILSSMLYSSKYFIAGTIFCVLTAKPKYKPLMNE